MISNPEYLRGCQFLHLNGLRSRPYLGQQLGRAMADVGFEEFVSLADDRLCSILTGKITQIGARETNLLFWIPNHDELVQQIDLSGGDLIGINYLNRREFEVAIRIEKTGQSVKVSDRLLALALLKGLAFSMLGVKGLDNLVDYSKIERNLIIAEM